MARTRPGVGGEPYAPRSTQHLFTHRTAPWLAVLALALVAATACAGRHPVVTPPPGPVTLAVITWNMHAGAGDLPRLVDDLVAGRLSSTPPANYVLLLQEAGAGGTHDPATLATDRHLALAFEPVRRSTTRTSGNAILSSLPLVTTRSITLPRERQPRGAMEATIDVSGTRLFVVNTHFENRAGFWRGPLFSDAARRRQAEALLRQIPPGPGIAGGDLNTWLGQEEPAWKAFAARFPDTPAGPAAPTFRDRLVLDHLFFDLPDGWRVNRRVVSDAYGSDHHPVLGTISVPS